MVKFKVEFGTYWKKPKASKPSKRFFLEDLVRSQEYEFTPRQDIGDTAVREEEHESIFGQNTTALKALLFYSLERSRLGRVYFGYDWNHFNPSSLEACEWRVEQARKKAIEANINWLKETEPVTRKEYALDSLASLVLGDKGLSPPGDNDLKTRKILRAEGYEAMKSEGPFRDFIVDAYGRFTSNLFYGLQELERLLRESEVSSSYEALQHLSDAINGSLVPAFEANSHMKRLIALKKCDPELNGQGDPLHGAEAIKPAALTTFLGTSTPEEKMAAELYITLGVLAIKVLYLSNNASWKNVDASPYASEKIKGEKEQMLLRIHASYLSSQSRLARLYHQLTF